MSEFRTSKISIGSPGNYTEVIDGTRQLKNVTLSNEIKDEIKDEILPNVGGLFKGNDGQKGVSADDIFRINNQVLTANVTISSTENAYAAGPVTVDSGVTLQVDAGGNLTIV